MRVPKIRSHSPLHKGFRRIFESNRVVVFMIYEMHWIDLMCCQYLAGLIARTSEAPARTETAEEGARVSRASLCCISGWVPTPSHPRPKNATTTIPSDACVKKVSKPWKRCDMYTRNLWFSIHFLNSYLVYDHTESERS